MWEHDGFTAFYDISPHRGIAKEAEERRRKELLAAELKQAGTDDVDRLWMEHGTERSE